MRTHQGMGRRPMKNADEQDVHTGWRKVYLWTQRPGATSRVKTRTSRRERHDARAEIRRSAHQ